MGSFGILVIGAVSGNKDKMELPDARDTCVADAGQWMYDGGSEVDPHCQIFRHQAMVDPNVKTTKRQK